MIMKNSFKIKSRCICVLLGILSGMVFPQWSYIKAPEKGLSSNYVRALAVYHDLLFAATDQGVTCISLTKDSSGVLNKAGLPKGVLTDLETVGDSLWIGATGGVGIYDLKKNVLSLISSEKSGIQNAVKCITPTETEVWLGTDGGGAYVYSRLSGEWSRYSKNSGLVSDNLRAISIVEDTLFFGTNALGLSLYSRKSDSWSQVTRYEGLSNNNITAIIPDRDRLFVCTYHGLTIFRKGFEDVQVRYKDNGLFDDMILTGIRDGRFLWLGGMGGLTGYDMMQDKMTVYNSAQGVPEDFITALAVYGNQLYIATDGKGIAVLDKGVPSARIDQVLFKGRTGSVLGNGFTLNGKTETAFSFYSPLASGVRFTKGLKSQGNRDGLLASWDLNGVIDGTYVLEMAVKTDKGLENSYSISVNTDTFDPELMLDEPPAYVNSNRLNLQGSFREKNVARILCYPGPADAVIDYAKRQFKATVDLAPGRNTVRAVIFDKSGQSMEVRRSVLYSNKGVVIAVMDAPSVTRERRLTIQGRIESDVPIKEMSLFPGSQAVTFDNTLHVFKALLSLSNEGENLFILKASDLCGNTASQKVSVTLDETGPEIRLSPLREFTADSLGIIQGNASDPNLQEISLLPGGAPLATDSLVKNFTFKPRLREGENTFVITSADKLGNLSQKTVTLIRDMKKPELAKPDLPFIVKEPFFTLTGRYDEDNLAGIRIEPGGVEATLCERTASYTARLKLENGENDFIIAAVDKAGNRNTLAVTINAKIDNADKAVQVLREQIKTLEQTIDSLKKRLETPASDKGKGR